MKKNNGDLCFKDDAICMLIDGEWKEIDFFLPKQNDKEILYLEISFLKDDSNIVFKKIFESIGLRQIDNEMEVCGLTSFTDDINDNYICILDIDNQLKELTISGNKKFIDKIYNLIKIDLLNSVLYFSYKKEEQDYLAHFKIKLFTMIRD